jgi:type I site-specific restriction endonuclease
MRTRVYNNKEQIFCEFRHRWVRLTPEEWVRQHLLHRLVTELGYPASLVAVEKAVVVGEAKKRFDAVVYTTSMQPLVLIECKADDVALTQKTLDQAITYNRKLHVPYIFLSNGAQTIWIHGTDTYTTGLPRYADLLWCE